LRRGESTIPIRLLHVPTVFKTAPAYHTGYPSLYGNLFNCFSKVYPDTTLWIFRCDLTSVYLHEIKFIETHSVV
jgi:hypothetical protein